MTKDELIQKLSDIEWDDFEVKQPKMSYPKIYGKRFLRLLTLLEGG